MTVSLVEIEEQWTMFDVAIAHDVLDLYDDVAAASAKDTRRNYE